MSPTTFVILALATWRISSLVANERGPFEIFDRMRRLARALCEKYTICRQLGLFELLECEWCNSVWIGTAFALAYVRFGEVVFYVGLPLALSTCTILVKYALEAVRRVA